MKEEDVLNQIKDKFDRAARLVKLSHKRSLTPREAAELYSYSEATLRNWRHQGRGPRFIRDGRLIQYRHKDIENYQENQLVRTRDQR